MFKLVKLPGDRTDGHSLIQLRILFHSFLTIVCSCWPINPLFRHLINPFKSFPLQILSFCQLDLHFYYTTRCLLSALHFTLTNIFMSSIYLVTIFFRSRINYFYWSITFPSEIHHPWDNKKSEKNANAIRNDKYSDKTMCCIFLVFD